MANAAGSAGRLVFSYNCARFKASAGEFVQTDQRQSPRKVFKTRAMLAVEGGAPVPARTTDIGAHGVSLTVPHPVSVGQSARLRFDLLVDGNVVPVNTRVKAQYCILSGGDFKVGFQFVNLEPAATSALSRFLR